MKPPGYHEENVQMTKRQHVHATTPINTAETTVTIITDTKTFTATTSRAPTLLVGHNNH